MTRFVLDTSAVLAHFWQEPGWERVAALLEGNDHVISTVNLAELATKIIDAGIPLAEMPVLISALRLKVTPFDETHALLVGELRAVTRHLGLSLGDRACLALAKTTGAVAVTSDRPWLQLDPALGFQTECIRPDKH